MNFLPRRHSGYTALATRDDSTVRLAEATYKDAQTQHSFTVKVDLAARTMFVTKLSADGQRSDYEYSIHKMPASQRFNVKAWNCAFRVSWDSAGGVYITQEPYFLKKNHDFS